MGGITARVLGSISLPAWTAIVSIFMGWSFYAAFPIVYICATDHTTECMVRKAYSGT